MTEKIKDIESALKKVKDQKENFGFIDRFTVDENWEVTKALEKQIPKKVKRKDIREYAIFYCPNNHFIFEEHCKFFDLNKHDFSKIGYCECCGQKLDWSDEDDKTD